MKKVLYVVLISILAICMLPMGAVLAASAFAAYYGCRLDEAGNYPCVINGHDWGGTLGTAFISGWYMLLMIPIAGIAATSLVILVLNDRFRRIRQ